MKSTTGTSEPIKPNQSKPETIAMTAYYQRFVLKRQALHIEQDIVLWTNSQRSPDDIHVMADVQSIDVHSARGGWEQASKDRSNKHQAHYNKYFVYTHLPL